MTNDKYKTENKFVSRAGIKLEAAIGKFNPPIANSICIDLGANVGGFTECLLKYGAKKIYAIEKGYGVLDYKLRKDPRVIVMERTNALYANLPELCDIAVIDIGWTKQKFILPATRKLIKPNGKIISLVKPHYEANPKALKSGVLLREQAEEILESIISELPNWNLRLIDKMQSPIHGQAGNIEYLLYLENQNI